MTLVTAGNRDEITVYRKRGTGAEVLKTTSISAGRLPTLRWHGGGDHRGTEQAKMAIEEIV